MSMTIAITHGGLLMYIAWEEQALNHQRLETISSRLGAPPPPPPPHLETCLASLEEYRTAQQTPKDKIRHAKLGAVCCLQMCTSMLACAVVSIIRVVETYCI